MQPMNKIGLRTFFFLRRQGPKDDTMLSCIYHYWNSTFIRSHNYL